MTHIFELSPGVTLRCFPDHRFKQSALSIQFVRPMCREEAALNALLPAVLLRGSESCPDLREITLKLDQDQGSCYYPLTLLIGWMYNVTPSKSGYTARDVLHHAKDLAVASLMDLDEKKIDALLQELQEQLQRVQELQQELQRVQQPSLREPVKCL